MNTSLRFAQLGVISAAVLVLTGCARHDHAAMHAMHHGGMMRQDLVGQHGFFWRGVHGNHRQQEGAETQGGTAFFQQLRHVSPDVWTTWVLIPKTPAIDQQQRQQVP